MTTGHPPRVLVPRGGSWGERVSALLDDAGFSPLVVPLIEIQPATDQDAFAARMSELGSGAFEWLVVTSQSTVRYLPHVPASTAVAAVGNVTAAALRERGIPVAFVPVKQSAAGLVDEWPIRGAKVLWPRAEDAKATIRDGLTERGCEVIDVIAYRTVPAIDVSEDPALTAVEPSDTPIDAVLVTSGSVAKQVLRLGLDASTTVVAIGQQTAEDCERAGLAVTAVAKSPTPEALVEALRQSRTR